MNLYGCDRCGKVYDELGYLNNLEINYAGGATVKFYHDGKFHVCPKCTTFFINELKESEKYKEEKNETE